MLSTHRFLKTFALFIISLSLLAIIFTLQRQLLNQRNGDDTNSALEIDQSRVEAFSKTQLDLWAQAPTMGFDNLIADWAFLQFLQYFGDDDARARTGYILSPDYFDVVIPNDPFYPYFYLFLSGSSSLYAGQPAHTVTLMNEGLSHMTPGVPEEGYLVWRYKGTDELLFLGDSEAAQQSFQTAANWAVQSDNPEAEVVAQLSQRTADFLANNPVSKRAQVDAWASILRHGADERTQRLAIEQIQALGGQVVISDEGRIQIGYPQQD